MYNLPNDVYTIIIRQVVRTKSTQLFLGMGQKYMKTKLHEINKLQEGTKLHEDKITQGHKIAQIHQGSILYELQFCTEGHFCTRLKIQKNIYKKKK